MIGAAGQGAKGGVTATASDRRVSTGSAEVILSLSFCCSQSVLEEGKKVDAADERSERRCVE